jgi:hypothetical protein
MNTDEITVRGKRGKALYYPPYVVAGTGANQILEYAGIKKWETAPIAEVA